MAFEDRRHGRDNLSSTAREEADGFACCHCGKKVMSVPGMGTSHRNHCTHCLWTKHVDENVSGLRNSACGGGMQPVGLTFKHAGVDKYGKPRQGDVMLIHACTQCDTININRIAADDPAELVLQVFVAGQALDVGMKERLVTQDIRLLNADDEPQVRTALFGKGR